MKSIAIAVGDIIGKWVTNEYTVPLKIALAASALIDPNFELSSRLLKYWFARMWPRTSTAQNGLQAIIFDMTRGGAPSKLSFFESSDSISAAC